MNLKFSIVVFVFVFVLIFSSADFYSQSKSKPIFIETNVVPGEDNYNCFISYRIPYKNLVFVKEDEEYISGMTLTVEAFSNEKITARESSIEVINSSDYAQTESAIEFLEGIVSFKLPEGNYKINPILNLNNTKRNIKLKPFELNIDSDSSSVVNPIAVNGVNVNLKDAEIIKIVNFGNTVPFTNKNINLILPIADLTTTKLDVKIEQNGEEVLSREFTSERTAPIVIKKHGGNVVLDLTAGSKKFNLFMISDFSSKLKEGKAKLIISGEGIDREIEFEVEWVDKPFSLLEPEFAINLLENIVDKSVVEKMLNSDEDDYYKELVEFWEPKDPVKETAVNEIMYEFYSRADIAIKSFATLNIKNGAKSDRGKIYIKYGSPDDIVRTFSDNNEVIEIWKYNKSNKEFTFVDKSGLGNFNLY